MNKIISTLKILIIEDNPIDIELLQIHLENIKEPFVSKVVSQKNDILEALDEFTPNMILSDFQLQGFTGINVMEWLKERAINIPIIIVTGVLSDDKAVDCMKEGAWDYILKDRINRLPLAVEGAVEKYRIILEEEQLELDRKLVQDSQNLAKMGTWKWEVKANKIYWSDKLFEIYEVNKNEFEYTIEGYFRRISPKDIERVKKIFYDALEDKEPFNFRETIITPKGDIKHLNSYGNVKLNVSGEAELLYGTSLDITDLVTRDLKIKSGEEKLEKSYVELKNAYEEINIKNKKYISLNEEYEKQNKNLINQTEKLYKAQEIGNIGHWELDVASGKLSWSNQIYNIFKLSPGEFEPSYDNFLKLIHPNDRGLVKNAYSTSLETKKPYEVTHRFIYPNGAIGYVSEKCETTYNKKGEPLVSMGTVLDVTEQKKSEVKSQIINSISSKLNSNIDIDEFCWHIFSELQSFMSIEDFYISNYDDIKDSNTYFFQIKNNQLSKEFQESRIAGNGLSEYIIKTKKGLFLNQGEFSSFYKKHKLTLYGKKISSWIGVPLISECRVVGVLAAQSFVDGLVFSQTDLELLSFIGTQVGSFIERQRAMKEIKQFETHFSVSTDLSCIANFDGFFVKTNVIFSETLGYTESELISRQFSEFIHPDDVEATNNEITKQSKGKKTINFINRYRCKNGKYIWLLWGAVADNDSNLIYAAAKDITVQKQKEFEIEKQKLLLKTNEERLNTIYNNVVDSVWLIDVELLDNKLEFRFVSVNDTFIIVTGFKKDDILGKKMEVVLPLETHEIVRAKYKEAYKLKETVEYREESKLPNGKIRYGNIKVIPIKDNKGNVTQLLSISVDVTKEIENKRKLDEQTQNIFNKNKEYIALNAEYETQNKKLVLNQESLIKRNIKLAKHKKVLLELYALKETDLKKTLRKIIKTASLTLGIERVSYWSFRKLYTELHCDVLYNAEDKSFKKESILTKSEYPIFFKALTDKKTIIAHDALANEETRELSKNQLIPVGVTSLLDEYVQIDGKSVGVVSFGHVGEKKTWEIEDEQFAASIASIISLAIESAERREAELKRKVSEQQLQSLFDHATVGIVFISIKNEIIKVNKALCGFLGYSEKELLKLAPSDITHPDDIEKTVNLNSQVLKGEIPNFTINKRYITKSGLYVWGELSSTVVRDTDNSILYGFGIIKDISDRVEAENTIQEQNKDLASRVKQYLSLNKDFKEQNKKLKKNQEVLLLRNKTIDTHKKVLLEFAALNETNLQRLLKTITRKCSQTLGVERVGFWRVQNNFSEIECNMLYKASEETFESGTVHKIVDHPNYFKAILKSLPIVAHDALTNKYTSEFSEDYLKPNGITSSLGIFVQRQTVSVGVICFEHVGKKRKWSVEDEQFAISIAGIISLALESLERREAELQLEKERKYILRAQFDGEEREKNRISAELHDGLGQILTAVKFSLTALENNDKLATITRGKINDIKAMVNEASTETRRISRHLLPRVLEDYGLLKAVEKMLLEIKTTVNIETTFTLNPEIEINAKKSRIVYRIIQESINNVIKHANATSLEVIFDTKDNYNIISISDNGNGFLTDVKKSGLGLGNIKQRALSIDADIDIKSVIGKGTSVVLKINK